VLDAQNRQRIRERGFVVYLSAGIESQLKRLQRDRTRPLLQRADREQVLRDLALQREPLYREVADLVMDTDGLTAADAATRLCLQLASRWNSDGVAA
jgi:shikimate kinase